MEEVRVESDPGRARGRVGSRWGHRTELGRKWIFFLVMVMWLEKASLLIKRRSKRRNERIRK